MNKLLLIFLLFTNFLFSQIQGSGVTDVDGNHYNSVVIGGQEWITENLRVKRFNNGEVINHVIDTLSWSTTNMAAWSYWYNDSSFQFPQGTLYNWYAVSDSRNICPNGWKAPSFEDLEILINNLGGYFQAGGNLKTTGTIQDGDGLWTSPNIASNSSGFSAVPLGYRDDDGSFGGTYEDGRWWCSTALSTNMDRAKYIELTSFTTECAIFDALKNAGFSVRCLKNQTTGLFENIQINDDILHITNILGQSIEKGPNQIMIIYYKSGAVKKVYITE